MAVSRKLEHIRGLDAVDRLLDSLIDPKFRKAALRSAGRKAMTPVKEALKSKIPSGDSDKSPYSHYQGSSKRTGYSSGDLRDGVKLRVTVNTDRKIKVGANGFAKGKGKAELMATVTFDNHVYKLASILENGRQRRMAKTDDGKVFHYFGNATDYVQRDIGTFEGKHFVSSTFAECENKIVSTFKRELISAIESQAKKMERENARG